MITRNPQTFQLTGPDLAGQTVTVATNDPRYYPMLVVFQDQQDTIPANSAKRDQYLNALNSYDVLVDAGRSQGAVPPVKPSMTVVDDFGKPSEVPFFPALPDAKIAAVATPQTNFGGDPASRPPDPNVVLSLHTALLQQILSDLQKIKAKLGA